MSVNRSDSVAPATNGVVGSAKMFSGIDAGFNERTHRLEMIATSELFQSASAPHDAGAQKASIKVAGSK